MKRLVPFDRRQTIQMGGGYSTVDNKSRKRKRKPRASFQRGGGGEGDYWFRSHEVKTEK